MRPDRIIVGECRSEETLDMLQAMNTGHDGSFTTIHANSPRDVVSRLDSMVLMSAVELPVRAIIERIVAPLGRRVDEANPMVDARLPDGSRVNAIIPPLSLKGPVLSIRKFARMRYGKDDLIRLNSLNPAMAKFIQASVLARKNIIISGGTG